MTSRLSSHSKPCISELQDMPCLLSNHFLTISCLLCISGNYFPSSLVLWLEYWVHGKWGWKEGEALELGITLPQSPGIFSAASAHSAQDRPLWHDRHQPLGFWALWTLLLVSLFWANSDFLDSYGIGWFPVSLCLGSHSSPALPMSCSKLFYFEGVSIISALLLDTDSQVINQVGPFSLLLGWRY